MSSTKAAGPADIKLKGWNAAQVEKAVQSLLKYIGKQQEQSADLLSDDDEMIYLQLSLKKMPLRSRKDKPVPLPLPHPILSPDGAEICLFVKDHQGEGHKEVKKRLEKFERKGGVSKVVGLSKLRTKYESHEAKRELCKLFDLFLADERILPMLPKLIGKSFFSKKKQPIPIDLTVKDFPAQVKKACGATYLFKGSGTCVNIRVARSSLSPAAIIANIHAALVQAVEHVPKKWSNIQGVFIKTSESVALPLFQTLPDAPPHKISTTPSSAIKRQQEKDEPKPPAPVPAATAKVAKIVGQPAGKATAPAKAAMVPAVKAVAGKAAAGKVAAGKPVAAAADKSQVASPVAKKREAPQAGKPAAKKQSR